MRNFLRSPSPLELATRELEDAQKNRLAATSQAEYYVAIENMYRDRIVRLTVDIQELLDAQKSEEKQDDRRAS